jgi:hypothetical protein
MNFRDGYGQWLDRSSVCWDESASVVVMVTDTCPCHYPNNYHSNKRWCCGDMYHLDLSICEYQWPKEPVKPAAAVLLGTSSVSTISSNPLVSFSSVPALQHPRTLTAKLQNITSQ